MLNFDTSHYAIESKQTFLSPSVFSTPLVGKMWRRCFAAREENNSLPCRFDHRVFYDWILCCVVFLSKTRWACFFFEKATHLQRFWPVILSSFWCVPWLFCRVFTYGVLFWLSCLWNQHIAVLNQRGVWIVQHIGVLFLSRNSTSICRINTPGTRRSF